MSSQSEQPRRKAGRRAKSVKSPVKVWYCDLTGTPQARRIFFFSHTGEEMIFEDTISGAVVVRTHNPRRPLSPPLRKALAAITGTSDTLRDRLPMLLNLENRATSLADQARWRVVPV